MKLLGTTNNKIFKDKNGENVPHLKITEVILVRCDIVNNDKMRYLIEPRDFCLLLKIWVKV